jgi:hypothetical protein
MSLTEKQIEEYRKKLGNNQYMKKAINGIAEKLSTGYAEYATAELPCAEPEIRHCL